MIKSKGHTPFDPAEARRRSTSLSEGGFKGAQIRKTLIRLSGRLREGGFKGAQNVNDVALTFAWGGGFAFQRRIKTSSNACIGLVFDFEFTLLMVFASLIAKGRRACAVDGGHAAKEHKPCAEPVFIFLPSSLRKVGRRRFSAGSEGVLTLSLTLSPPCYFAYRYKQACLYC